MLISYFVKIWLKHLSSDSAYCESPKFSPPDRGKKTLQSLLCLSRHIPNCTEIIEPDKGGYQRCRVWLLSSFVRENQHTRIGHANILAQWNILTQVPKKCVGWYPYLYLSSTDMPRTNTSGEAPECPGVTLIAEGKNRDTSSHVPLSSFSLWYEHICLLHSSTGWTVRNIVLQNRSGICNERICVFTYLALTAGHFPTKHSYSRHFWVTQSLINYVSFTSNSPQQWCAVPLYSTTMAKHLCDD